MVFGAVNGINGNWEIIRWSIVELIRSAGSRILSFGEGLKTSEGKGAQPMTTRFCVSRQNAAAGSVFIFTIIKTHLLHVCKYVLSIVIIVCIA